MVWTPSRIALAAVTAVVVVAGVGAGILLQPGSDPAEPAARGPDVSIAVVAPREPEPDPGSVMEVGDLADAYTHQGYAPPAAIITRPDAAYEDEPAPRAVQRIERPRVAPAPAPRPVIVDRPEPQRRWPFGFDQPRPDYAAERRERRAQRDEQRRREEDRRFEEARAQERPEYRNPYPEPLDDRDREIVPDRDRGVRERQWYSGDGRPVDRPGDRY